jgi:hypothetical protein
VTYLTSDVIPDILVANLGSPRPTDRRCGSVVLLRALGQGRFQPHTLLEGVGRVTDVQAALWHQGKRNLDLFAATAGRGGAGELLILENQTADWNKPRFVPDVLERHPAAFEVARWNLGGAVEAVFALLHQERETVALFGGDGQGHFTKKILYRAPRPGSGSIDFTPNRLSTSSGADPILFTNGVAFDQPYVPRPDHGVYRLERPDGVEWVPRYLAPMYGVQRATIADFARNGYRFTVAVAYLPQGSLPGREAQELDSVIVLEETAPGVFARSLLETGNCHHVSCAVGDVFGRGKEDLVVANFGAGPASPAITIWKNLGMTEAWQRRQPAPAVPQNIHK